MVSGDERVEGKGAPMAREGRSASFLPRHGPNEQARNNPRGRRGPTRETQTRERGRRRGCAYVCYFSMSACICARARVHNKWDETEERCEEETTQDLTGMRYIVARTVANALRWAFLSPNTFTRFKWDGDNSATELQKSVVRPSFDLPCVMRTKK